MLYIVLAVLVALATFPLKIQKATLDRPNAPATWFGISGDLAESIKSGTGRVDRPLFFGLIKSKRR